MKSRVENSKVNIIWGVAYRVTLLLCPFILRTVMIHTMGLEYAGLGNLFSSIIQILSLSDLGVGAALVFFMYKPIYEENNKMVNALLNFYKNFYYFIGSFIVIVGLILAPFLKYIIKGSYPSDINIHVLYLIYILNTSIGYFFGAYKRSILYASQRMDIESKVLSLFTFIQYIVQISVLVMTKNYYLYIIVLPITTLISNLIIANNVDKKYPQYKADGKLEDNLIKEIQKKSGGIVFQKIGNVILTSVDTLVVSAFLGLSVLTVYNNYLFVVSALHSILNIILISIIPSVGNSVLSEGVEKNYSDFKKFNLLYSIVLSWAGCCLFVLYQPFMKIWMHNVTDYNMFLSYFMVVLFVVYFYTLKIGDIVFAYNEGAGLWDKRKYISIGASVTNLAMNLATVKIFGLYGVVLSSIISVLFISIPAESYVLFKFYFKKSNEWFTYIIGQLRFLVKMVIIAGITFVACMFKIDNLLIDFFVKALVCVVLSTVLHYLVYYKEHHFVEVINFIKFRFFKFKEKR